MKVLKSVLSNSIGILAGMLMFSVLSITLSTMSDAIWVVGGLSGALSLAFGLLVNVFFDKIFKLNETTDV